MSFFEKFKARVFKEDSEGRKTYYHGESIFLIKSEEIEKKILFYGPICEFFQALFLLGIALQTTFDMNKHLDLIFTLTFLASTFLLIWSLLKIERLVQGLVKVETKLSLMERFKLPAKLSNPFSLILLEIYSIFYFIFSLNNFFNQSSSFSYYLYLLSSMTFFFLSIYSSYMIYLKKKC